MKIFAYFRIVTAEKAHTPPFWNGRKLKRRSQKNKSTSRKVDKSLVYQGASSKLEPCSTLRARARVAAVRIKFLTRQLARHWVSEHACQTDATRQKHGARRRLTYFCTLVTR